MTGYVSDETAQGIGRILGVEFVVTGQMRDIGRTRRFVASAIHVETARHASVPRFDVRNDAALLEIIAALRERLVPAPAPVPMPVTGLVRVEGGTFRMDHAARSVTVGSFYMGLHPVTQGQWYDVMGTRPGFFDGRNAVNLANWSVVPASPTHDWRDLPVEQVSWFDAIEFCNRLSAMAGLTPAYTIAGVGNDRVVAWNRNANGYRLPTEAEWEFAARGGNACRGNFAFSGSDNAGEVAWYVGNSGGRTHPVGRLRPNALGLYDMGGNVFEWVWDWHGPYPNPAGTPLGTGRVRRGGGWLNSSEHVRSTTRARGNPSAQLSELGFRVARPLP